MSLSTFLNGRAASQLRGVQWLAFSESGVALSATVSSDSGGGGSVVWAAAGTFACRVDPLGAANNGRVTGGQIDERSTHVVMTQSGATVGASDRFAITGRGTFEVTAVRQVTAEFAHSFEVVQVS